MAAETIETLSKRPYPASSPTNEPSPLAVDAKKLGAMLGLSTRTVRTLDTSGKLPRPVKIGRRSVRWCVSEIEEWLQAACPDRQTWEALNRNGRCAQ